MIRSRLFTAVLLAGTGLSSQQVLAQDAPQAATPPVGETVAQPDAEGEVEVSTPGGDGPDIVVTGKYIPETVRNTAQVVNVISAEELSLIHI